MKLKIKNLDWFAGRPVVILNLNVARKLNVRVDERVHLMEDDTQINAVVDLFQGAIKDDEIGISKELAEQLITKEGKEIEVTIAPISPAADLINKKLSGKELSKDEINLIISEIVQNSLTESEIAYFVAAEKLIGMSEKEIYHLVESMVASGKVIKFKQEIVADKHCVGGLAGNRTTPIVISICAAAGLTLPKTSSRAITSASGTADVIETLSRVDFSAEELKSIVEKVGACLAWGGALGLAPSDDKIIHVERIINLDVEPQLLASIMSKKISAGSNHILIDIPYGSNTKIKTRQLANDLGEKFKKLGTHFNLKIKVILTNGENPIGRGIGPVLEMFDILSVLQNKPDMPLDLRKKSISLASELMSLCEIKNSKEKAEEMISSGKAYQKFKEIINAQNGKEKNSKDFEERVENLSLGKFKQDFYSDKSGKIISINNKQINHLARVLGTPETKSAGLYLHKNLGSIVKGEKTFTVYSESKVKLRNAVNEIKKSNPYIIK